MFTEICNVQKGGPRSSCTYIPDIIILLDIGKLTEMSHLANCILLPQLIATLIHYPYTVALVGLADWSAFLKLVLPTM